MTTEDLYLDLLIKSLTDTTDDEKEHFISKKVIGINTINKLLKPFNYEICKKRIINKANGGLDRKIHAPNATSLIGRSRMNCIKECYDIINKENIEGDILEAGVWKGGATIFMNALLKVNNDQTRKVYAADSFEGCPPATLEEDKEDKYSEFTFLQAGIDLVKSNFKKYNLLNDNVFFLKGWFKDTLPDAPFTKLSLIRADGDMYESTMDILENTYHKLSVGGFVLIDDYGAIEACKKVVDDFRRDKNINDEIIKVDWTGVYWRKSA